MGNTAVCTYHGFSTSELHGSVALKENHYWARNFNIDGVKDVGAWACIGKMSAFCFKINKEVQLFIQVSAVLQEFVFTHAIITPCVCRGGPRTLSVTSRPR